VSAWQTYTLFDASALEAFRFSNLLQDVVEAFPEDVVLEYDMDTKHLTLNQHLPFYADLPFISKWAGEDVHQTMSSFFRLEFTTEENVKMMNVGRQATMPWEAPSVVLVTEVAFYTTKLGLAGVMDSMLSPSFRERTAFGQQVAGVMRTFCVKKSTLQEYYQCTKNIVRGKVLSLKQKRAKQIQALDETLMVCVPLLFAWGVMFLVSLVYYIYIMLTIVTLYVLGNLACQFFERPYLSVANCTYLALYSSTPVIVGAYACSSLYTITLVPIGAGYGFWLYHFFALPAAHALWASFIWCRWVYPQPQYHNTERGLRVAQQQRHLMHAQQVLQRTLRDAHLHSSTAAAAAAVAAAAPSTAPAAPPFMLASALPLPLPPPLMPMPMMPMMPTMLLDQMTGGGGEWCTASGQEGKQQEMTKLMLQRQIRTLRENLLRVRRTLVDGS
jgi:hypothetical protein